MTEKVHYMAVFVQLNNRVTFRCNYLYRSLMFAVFIGSIS